MEGEGDTQVDQCVGLHVRKTELCSLMMLCFEVGDRFDSFKYKWQLPRLAYALPSPVRSSTSFAIARCCVCT